MTKQKLEALFEKYEDEYANFMAVENKRSNRPDLHALMLLDELCPAIVAGDSDIMFAAAHDEVWLDIDVEKLAKVATEEQILELIRCGVHYDEAAESLAFFT